MQSENDEYYSIERRKEIKDEAKKLRRKFLRYKEAEIVYSIQHKKLLELAGYLPEFENVTEFETKGMVSIPVVGVIHGGPPHEAREEIIDLHVLNFRIFEDAETLQGLQEKFDP